jgi:hypothetical protein
VVLALKLKLIVERINYVIFEAKSIMLKIIDMNRILFLMVLGLTIVYSGHAQVMATTGSVEYAKGQTKRSSVIELPYAPEVIEDALKNQMAKKGYKLEKSKGAQIYRGVKLDGDSELTDLHFIVERKSRKEKNVSLVNLIVGRSSENIAVRSDLDEYKADYGKTFLNNFVPTAAAYQLELNIKDQDDVIKKAEKKLRNLEDDQKSLEKRIQDTEDKLAQNKKDQDSQNAELMRQKAVRDEMMSRRAVAP